MNNSFVVKEKAADELSFVDTVHRTECKVVLYHIENNIAIRNVAHIKDIVSSPKAVAAVKLKRDKAMQIIENVLAPVDFLECVAILKSNPFSVLTDESTDCSNKKILAVAVQYFNFNLGKIVTHTLTLIELNALSCTAQKLYAAFKSFFVAHEIPLRNIIGIGTDNASVMTGEHKSFCKFLKNDVPNLIVMNCVCHSCNLAAQTCCSVIPKSVETLLRAMSTYFSISRQRSADLKDFQDYHKVKPLKFLKLAGTRWLSLHNCATRFLHNLPAAKPYFDLKSVETMFQSNPTAVNIQKLFNSINNPIDIACIHFLSFSLEYFSKFNVFFQSLETRIHLLYDRYHDFINSLAINCLKNESVIRCHDKNFVLSDNDYLPLNDIYIGDSTEQYFNNPALSSDDVLEARKKFLAWYRLALADVRHRFLEHDEFFKFLKFSNPTIALDSSYRDKN
ncbi:hypothetical protein TKK_0015472 [Trichogramma kaykai]